MHFRFDSWGREFNLTNFARNLNLQGLISQLVYK